MYPINPETLPISHEDLGEPKTVTHATVASAVAAFKASGNRPTRLPPQRLSRAHQSWFLRQARREEVQRRHDLLNQDEGRTFDRGDAEDMDVIERGAHNHIPTQHCAVCEVRAKAAVAVAAALA